jgi:putative transposase
VLAILVQSRRNKQAAKKFFRTLLQGLQYVPRVIMTDKLKRDGAAKRERLPGVAPRQSRSRKNRCEHAHRPPRQRERRMQGFTSAGHAQRCLSAYGPMAQHCHPRRHRLSAPEYRQEMRQRFESWAAMTGTERAA